jgi:capsular exopolysaccharide synthesis family protein
MDALNQEDEHLQRITAAMQYSWPYQLVGIARRQYKIIVFTTILALIFAGLLLVFLEKRYTAAALILVDESESQLVGIEAGISANARINGQVDTEVEVLKSSSVALKAIEKLRLWEDAEFVLGSPIERLLSFLSRNNNKTVSAETIDQLTNSKKAQLIDNFSDALRISQRGLTSIISIEATSFDSKKAANLANAIAEAYFEVQTVARAQTAKRAAEFLQLRVSELADTIRVDNERVIRFLEQNQRSISNDNMNLSASELSAILKERVAKEAQLMELAQYRLDLDPAHLERTEPPLGLKQLIEQRTALIGNNNGDLVELDSQIRNLVTKEIDKLRAEVAGYNIPVAGTKDERSDQVGNLPPSVVVDYYRLQREAETNRKLYDSYVSRLGDVQQKIGLAFPNSRLVAPAIAPYKPSFPPTALILALGIIVGLGLGICGAVLREHIVGGFVSAEQLEAITGLTVPSVIPFWSKGKPHDAILSSPFSPFSEALRRLRVGLENQLPVKPSTVVLVTSTQPNEGKTTMAVALARTMAASGRRTLLIDCDLRHPAVDRLIEISAPAKLLTFLLSPPSPADLRTAVARDNRGGIDVLGTESSKHASDVFLASSEFTRLVEVAKSCYDMVIIDSPPIGYVIDANVISRLCDGIVYVVRYATTNQRDVIVGLRDVMSGAGTSKAVVVLNAAGGEPGRYSYRGGKYSYYYSES